LKKEGGKERKAIFRHVAERGRREQRHNLVAAKGKEEPERKKIKPRKKRHNKKEMLSSL